MYFTEGTKGFRFPRQDGAVGEKKWKMNECSPLPVIALKEVVTERLTNKHLQYNIVCKEYYYYRILRNSNSVVVVLQLHPTKRFSEESLANDLAVQFEVIQFL
jgi:hypothetical protein